MNLPHVEILTNTLQPNYTSVPHIKSSNLKINFPQITSNPFLNEKTLRISPFQWLLQLKFLDFTVILSVLLKESSKIADDFGVHSRFSSWRVWGKWRAYCCGCVFLIYVFSLCFFIDIYWVLVSMWWLLLIFG